MAFIAVIFMTLGTAKYYYAEMICIEFHPHCSRNMESNTSWSSFTVLSMREGGLKTPVPNAMKVWWMVSSLILGYTDGWTDIVSL